MKKTIYIFNDGEIYRKDNTIYFEGEDGKKYLPVEDIGEICVIGEVGTSKKFLEFCTSNQIVIHYFNHHEYYVGSYYPREHYNSGYMILNQAEHYLDICKRKCLAYKFIKGSALNIINVLKYYNSRGKDIEKNIENIVQLLDKLDIYMDIDQMMAIEGNIREVYYAAFDDILENNTFSFDVRSKRPPLNKMNSLISFGNSLLYTSILSEIYNTHLDPRIGYLHSTNNRRFTLNLDVAEIFKPIIVDRIIFTLIGKKMIQAKHFNKSLNSVLLNEEGMKIFISLYEEKLQSVFMHKELGRNVSYRRLIRMELYKIEKHLMSEKNYEPFISKW
ncbi:type I-B CRISPR-associated endonuclease Cas1b [Sedimentibacter sp.]|uniref:type I-B CRISPR-associated endonuclease Cas1b n=1 Tax=Sedimentibacter sp. TaxID=1960295 RepID=UPI0028AB5DC7|nr:type I-B CRISPR-associated endonuclease Cas1b [Sedimentibacter sp.]